MMAVPGLSVGKLLDQRRLAGASTRLR